MPSVQDHETRLKTVEDKLDFVMRFFQLSDPLSPFSKPKSLLDFYREVVNQGPYLDQIKDVNETPVESAESEPAPLVTE